MMKSTPLSEREWAIIQMMRSGQFDVQLNAYNVETSRDACALLVPLIEYVGKSAKFLKKEKSSCWQLHDGVHMGEGQIRATAFIKGDHSSAND